MEGVEVEDHPAAENEGVPAAASSLGAVGYHADVAAELIGLEAVQRSRRDPRCGQESVFFSPRQEHRVAALEAISLSLLPLQIEFARGDEVEIGFIRGWKEHAEGWSQPQPAIAGPAQPHAKQQFAEGIALVQPAFGVSVKHLGLYGIDHPGIRPICRHSSLLKEVLRMQNENAEDVSAAGAKEILPAWGAVVSMGLGVFGLVGAEFLPASLLTPMAWELGVSEGLAGQAVTATAVIGFATSLSITAVTRRIDRRLVLLAFSLLLVLSNLLVAVAPNLLTLLAGRLLLGVALGGFWTLSAAVIMRLVPERLVPTALSIQLSGLSAATIFAAPVGAYLGAAQGWRMVFLAAAALGLLVFLFQFLTLPSLPPRGQARFKSLFEVLSRRHVSRAMLAILLIFVGHFAFFTYIRPFLEGVTGLEAGAVSLILLVFGIANFLGNYLAAYLLGRSMRLTLTIMPLLMGSLAFTLSSFGGAVVLDAVLV